MAAGIYLLLGSSGRIPSAQEPALRARAAALIDGILAEDPNHADALLGSASLAETGEERVRRLRRAVAANPNDAGYLELLASALRDDPGNLPEAAALLERAYELQIADGPSYRAWRFARNAIFIYEWAGLAERAARLRSRARGDFAVDAKLRELARAATLPSERLDALLADLCAEIAMFVVGGETCLAAIQHVVDAADRATGTPAAARLADSASRAMFDAATHGGWLERADPAWRRRFEAALERHHGPEAAARLRDTLPIILVE